MVGFLTYFHPLILSLNYPTNFIRLINYSPSMIKFNKDQMKNSTKTNVTIIIANYNSTQVLQDCLKHLTDLKLIKNTVIVDNASNDGSVEMVKENFPSAELISLKENKGISYSYNLGASKAKTKYLLFLGSDAFPENNSIPYLENYFDNHPDVGVATCKIVTRNGDLDMDSHRAFPTPWISFLYFTKINSQKYFMKDKNFNETHEIDVCISHFMFVRKNAFDAVDGFDQDYFVYGEDIDFCYRIKNNRWKIIYIPQVKTLHYKGVSVGLRKESKDIAKVSKATKIKMSKMSVEAMELFYNKHYLKNYPLLLNLLISLTFKLFKLSRILKTQIS